jgi:hypothetical protein
MFVYPEKAKLLASAGSKWKTTWLPLAKCSHEAVNWEMEDDMYANGLTRAGPGTAPQGKKVLFLKPVSHLLTRVSSSIQACRSQKLLRT